MSSSMFKCIKIFIYSLIYSIYKDISTLIYSILKYISTLIINTVKQEENEDQRNFVCNSM